MSDRITDRLDAIMERADNAIEGPWETGWDGQEFYLAPVSARGNAYQRITEWTYVVRPGNRIEMDECDTYDAEFIAAARTDVPQLVAAHRAVLALHRPMTMYEHEDVCEDTSDEHREERHLESVDHGEYHCLDLPTGIVLCAECSRDLDFGPYNYPCETVRTITAALGENA